MKISSRTRASSTSDRARLCLDSRVMLAVARVVVPDPSIQWCEASMEEMPLPDEAFDTVLCQMGLQFVPDKTAALRQMHRTLVPGGRIALNMPGPAGPPFEALADALEAHVSPEAAGFMRMVFSLNDVAEIEALLLDTGFKDARVEADMKELRLPPARDFLWQYVHSTPLAAAIEHMDHGTLAVFEGDVLRVWRAFEDADGMRYDQRVVVATAQKGAPAAPRA